jgi:hypothetical protein
MNQSEFRRSIKSETSAFELENTKLKLKKSRRNEDCWMNNIKVKYD